MPGRSYPGRNSGPDPISHPHGKRVYADAAHVHLDMFETKLAYISCGEEEEVAIDIGQRVVSAVVIMSCQE